jgi:hypothetical protein
MLPAKGNDYAIVIVTGSGGGKGSATPLKEYYGTLDMGKELAMVENNEQGRRMRSTGSLVAGHPIDRLRRPLQDRAKVPGGTLTAPGRNDLS